ncbi:MAG: hypothetical protein ACLP1X_02500, partial [Polyangiaceae bacterium]
MAMVMSYSYERVLADSVKYAPPDGEFFEWWVQYLHDEGFKLERRCFDDLRELSRHSGAVVGLLCMNIPRIQRAHIVAVDE